MSDPVEIVAKHVRELRYAERGAAVGPKVDEEDREIARDILGDLAGTWRLVRVADAWPGDNGGTAMLVDEEWKP